MNNRCRTIKMIRLIKKESVQFSSDSLWTIINLSVERKEDTFSKPSLLTVHVAFNILAIPKTFPFPEITPRNQHQIVPHYRQPNRQSNWNYLWLRSWSYQPTLDIRIAQSREDKVILLPPSPFNPPGYLSTSAQLTFPIVSFDFSNLENRSPRKKKEREREENRYKLDRRLVISQ